MNARIGATGPGAARPEAAGPEAAGPEAAEIMARCDALAGITDTPGMSRRVHLSLEHRQAAELVEEWMREAGLRTWQDQAGNVCGRIDCADPSAPALLLGSHIDTVADAGRYDGMLGVLLAIAVAGRVRHEVPSWPVALEVVAFTDEEGTRFGTALSGSRALSGGWDAALLDRTDESGTSYAEALVQYGLDPGTVGAAARRPGSLAGYLEAHIEQGPYLEAADRALGVVTSIAGARRFALTVTGRAGHAGGTPYERRQDALTGASELVLAVERIGRETGVIATVGRLQAYPGGVNVIPGRVELSLDLRAEHDGDRDAVWDRIQAEAAAIAARRRLSVHAEEQYRADATPCDPRLREAVHAGIAATGDTAPVELWSRAGHDGMAVAEVTGVAMLFLRCAGGVSHHPDESVTEADVAAALTAFETAVRVAAQKAAGGTGS
jgi:allantoate deiminase